MVMQIKLIAFKCFNGKFSQEIVLSFHGFAASFILYSAKTTSEGEKHNETQA